MKRVKVRLNSKGVQALLQDPALVEDLQARADRIAAAAGGAPDFEVDAKVLGDRASALVVTATQAGREAEATDRALTRAIDAGR